MTRRLALILAAFAGPALGVGACGGDKEQTTFGPAPGASGKPGAQPAQLQPGQPAQPAPPSPGPQTASPTAADAGAALANLPPLPPAREPDEAAFTETDRNRDPFRSFETVFVSQEKSRAPLQRNALADRYGLDDLKLVGIVTRAPARVLLTDPAGVGWVAKLGDFVGRAELVHVGGPGGNDVPLSWRVDRIRPADVVFTRADPSHPDMPPATRVIPLYPVDQSASAGAAPAGSAPMH